MALPAALSSALTEIIDERRTIRAQTMAVRAELAQARESSPAVAEVRQQIEAAERELTAATAELEAQLEQLHARIREARDPLEHRLAQLRDDLEERSAPARFPELAARLAALEADFAANSQRKTELEKQLAALEFTTMRVGDARIVRKTKPVSVTREKLSRFAQQHDMPLLVEQVWTFCTEHVATVLDASEDGEGASEETPTRKRATRAKPQ